MAALICKGLCLPCKLVSECFSGLCTALDDACAPIAKFLCNPEHPFSTCFLISVLVTVASGVLTLGVIGSSFSGMSAACSVSGLHTTTIVHVVIFAGHFAFAYYLNKSFLEVERGHDVVKKFRLMFLYDPVVLVYILFLIFQVVWLGFTQTAIADAQAEGCCDAYDTACSVAHAVFAIEIAYLVCMPGVVALSLFNECCVGDRKRIEEARQRQQAKYDARGGPVSLGARMLGAATGRGPACGGQGPASGAPPPPVAQARV
mmetsp:Transcript_10117/g.26237  ORF Transcript_10117/g.26237 Transcript_10117/m.26237 type:complete len:260 (+) Transcript_10117:74-853(+)